ncbi:MAG TPA: hypothetical protein VIL46_17120, partial [Gemmataceae bacterium]
MTAARRRMPPVLALAAALPFLAGCLGGTQNPSYFPWLLPAGDIVRTHAKPPGKGYFRNFDPNAFRLEVRPLAAVRPVGTEQVYIATVYDESGTPRRGRRVEWLLEGAGNIIEVDESGYLPGRGYKVDNRYAVSYTDYKEHLITRGNADPSDDFMIRPGQTWCVVSSAVEGETALTAYAPAVHDWDRHRVVVKTAWLDAQCEFPGGAVLPTGGEHVITSKVYRPSDRRPLADYRVRYRVLDGPPAVLLSHPAGASFKQGATEVVVASDAEGEAEVRVAPLSTRPGVTRVEVEVVRPSDPGDPNAGETVVARGVTRLEWRAADVTLTVTGPPEAPVGGEAPVTISVANEGQVPSGAVTVRAEVPPGWEYVRSDPPARPEGGALVWELPPLAGEQQHLLQARFLPRRAGKATIRAAVRTADGHAARE